MPLRKPPVNSWLLFSLLILGVGGARLISRQLSMRTVAAQSELPTEPPLADAIPDAVAKEYGYQRHLVKDAIAHIITLPAETSLSIAVATDLATVEDFAAQTEARYVINGGFFDPNNGKTTSYLISQGQVVGDPADNERLVSNPALSQYMPQILNRSEFRGYRCQGDDTPVYDITFRDVSPPEGCRLDIAVGGGPQLLPVDTAQIEAFVDYENDAIIRDAIGSLQPNARSAVGLYDVGLYDEKAIALIMVEKGPSSSGLTLLELSNFATSLGITQLLNLDGGSSSSLFVIEGDAAESQTYFGLSDEGGNPVRRAVKSVIIVND